MRVSVGLGFSVTQVESSHSDQFSFYDSRRRGAAKARGQTLSLCPSVLPHLESPDLLRRNVCLQFAGAPQIYIGRAIGDDSQASPLEPCTFPFHGRCRYRRSTSILPHRPPRAGLRPDSGRQAGAAVDRRDLSRGERQAPQFHQHGNSAPQQRIRPEHHAAGPRPGWAHATPPGRHKIRISQTSLEESLAGSNE